MLKKIKVKNFRSLHNFSTEFNEGLNVIIGENDAGKTSLIDSLKILFGKKSIDINDFRNTENEVIIELETEDLVYRFISKLVDDKIENTFENKPTREKCDEILSIINSEEFACKSDNEKRNDLKKFGSIFDINVRSNSKPETVINNISKVIGELSNNDEFIETKELSYAINFLGSKEIEDMNSFFEDTFFKEFKQNIYDSKVGEHTINELINGQIDSFKDEVLSEDNTKELYDILGDFLPNFKEIELEISQSSKITLYIDVNFLNSEGQEISLEKMGDGTNRRTTMALFRHKQDKDDLCYVFDEPDTHLHIKAQLDIFNLFKELTSNGKQVIITTHSPFLINEASPKDIKFMKLDDVKKSIIGSLSDDIGPNFLKDLGITNIDLFFTNKLLLVEGESEEIFIPRFFEKIYGYPLSHKFIKIVNVKSINKIQNFVTVIKDTFPEMDIFILIDNDASQKEENRINDLIRKYEGITEDCIFKLGNKEFEDSFSNEILAKSVNDYIAEELDSRETIDVEDIEEIRAKGGKFSGHISGILWEKFNVNLNKPELARILANKSENEDVDRILFDLFETLLK